MLFIKVLFLFIFQIHYVSNISTESKNDLHLAESNSSNKIDKCIRNKNYCKECNEEKDLCISCDESYFPDESGRCSYSDNCKYSENGKCITCKDDFILIGEEDYFNNGIKICKWIFSENLKFCQKINTKDGSCEKCNEGFYLNFGDKKCSLTENCSESIFNACIKCIDGYYLNKKEDKCQKQNSIFEHCQESIDGLKCDICQNDYYLDENGKCISINYCLKLSTEKNNTYDICEKCFSNYYLSKNNDSCTTTDNCFVADKVLGLCQFCNEGYYLDYKDGKCKPNSEDNEYHFCTKVENDICIQCIFPTYYLGEDNKCSTSPNCEESDQGICIKCRNNYFLDLYKNCIKVENCKISDGFECFECIENYYYDINNKKCKMDSDIHYKNCKKAYEGWFCDTCKENFYLNQTDHLCYSNKPYGNFYKCEKVENNFGNQRCVSCIKNFYLGYKDNKCTTVNGCILSDDENNCIECDNYHCLVLSNKTCEYNYKIINEEKKFYYRCKITNKEGNRCEICMGNYTVNEHGICVDQEEDICAEKNEGGECVKCKNDEEGQYCLNDVFGCVKKYFNKCLECNYLMDFEKCTKCLEGYELNEKGECI